MLRAVVEQHAEDAAFLWTRRQDAAAAPDVRLEDLIRLDERLEANLDGLRIAGKGGAKIARRALDGGEAGEVFAAAVLAADDGGALAALVEEVGTGGREAGVAGALAWLPAPRALGAVERLRGVSASGARWAALVGLAAHRRDDKAAIDAALLDDDARLTAVAVRMIGELRRVDRAAALEVAAQADEREVRFWAAWSALLLGDARAARVLQAIAIGGGELAEASATFAAIALPPDEARAWIVELAGDGARHRAAFRAAAALGDPIAIPILLDALEVPERARIAADAFTTITGVAIDGDLAGSAPEGFVAGPTDDPEDEDVTPDPDARLAWPRAAEVRAAWARREKDLAPGVRHLLGRTLSRASLVAALVEGRQPERARAAFELARAGEPLFDVAAPADRQRAALRNLGAVPPTVLGSYA